MRLYATQDLKDRTHAAQCVCCDANRAQRTNWHTVVSSLHMDHLSGVHYSRREGKDLEFAARPGGLIYTLTA